MCIAVIKRSLNPIFSFFVSFNRDELRRKAWRGLGHHWANCPNVYGYYDVDSGGSWLVSNNRVLVFIINKESIDCSDRSYSRSNIVLNTLHRSNTAYEAITKMNQIDTDLINPFNLITIDKNEVYYYSTPTNEVTWANNEHNEKLTDGLILINRSFPNDFSQTRIKVNFQKFLDSQEPDPINDQWGAWDALLKDYCYSNSQKTEYCMSLVSDDWETKTSTIIAIPKAINRGFVFHQVGLDHLKVNENN